MPFWNRPSLFLSTLDEAFIYRFQDILDQPLLYLSAFFERNKGLYYDNLTFVREKNDLLQWLKYFLVGTAHTAEDAVATLSKILSLRNRLEQRVRSGWGRRVGKALALLHHLFKDPVLTIKKVEEICDLSPKAAGNLVDTFERAGILKEKTGQSRNRLFLFEPYVRLFE